MSNNPHPGNDGFGHAGFNLPPGATGGVPLAPRGPLRQDPPTKDKGAKKWKKDKAPKTATKRLLNKQKVFALLFAIIAVVLALNLSRSGRNSTQTFVARTTSEIYALAKIEPSQYEVVALPAAAVEVAAISGQSEQEVRDKISVLITGRVRMALPKGHQLHQNDFSADAALAEPLKENERILALEASVVSAIGGQLRAGDRVDVIAVIGYQNKTYSNIVASDLEIIAALPSEQQFNSAAQEQARSRDKTGNELLPTEPVPGIYNVRVTVEQAILLAAAQTKGELVFVLRGSDAASTDSSAVDLESAVIKGNTGATPLPEPDPAG
jgi:Flp pilus assembly protein CpaB